jgi:hypothetical protein
MESLGADAVTPHSKGPLIGLGRGLHEMGSAILDLQL